MALRRFATRNDEEISKLLTEKHSNSADKGLQNFFADYLRQGERKYPQKRHRIGRNSGAFLRRSYEADGTYYCLVSFQLFNM